MRRASVLWDTFVTRFEAVLARQTGGSLSVDEADEALGVSGRQFRRLRVRYASDGAAGLADRAAHAQQPRAEVRAAGEAWARRLAAGAVDGLDAAALAGQLMALRHAMWGFLGIVRTAEGLAAGLQHVGGLAAELADRGPAPGWRARRAWCELRSLCDTGLLSLTAALHRRESRGAQYRADFPVPDDAHWLGTIRLVQGDDGVPVIAFLPVADRVAA